jgi:hypothetical protein
VFIVFEATFRAVQRAIMRPGRETLFTVVSREDKYKSKAFIDTFVYRGGDAVGAQTEGLLGRLGMGLAALAAVAVPLAIVWAALGVWLGRRSSALPSGSGPARPVTQSPGRARRPAETTGPARRPRAGRMHVHPNTEGRMTDDETRYPTRREALRIGAAAALGLTVGRLPLHAASYARSPRPARPARLGRTALITKAIPSSGERIPVIGLGTNRYSVTATRTSPPVARCCAACRTSAAPSWTRHRRTAAPRKSSASSSARSATATASGSPPR